MEIHNRVDTVIIMMITCFDDDDDMRVLTIQQSQSIVK